MTLGNVKTSKPLTVDVNTTIFSLNNAIFSWKCPVDVILKPRIHLKIAPLMAATSLSGT